MKTFRSGEILWRVQGRLVDHAEVEFSPLRGYHSVGGTDGPGHPGKSRLEEWASGGAQPVRKSAVQTDHCVETERGEPFCCFIVEYEVTRRTVSTNDRIGGRADRVVLQGHKQL